MGLKPKLHYFDLSWVCCATCCTTNPQQIEVMEFKLKAIIIIYSVISGLPEQRYTIGGVSTVLGFRKRGDKRSGAQRRSPEAIL